MNREDIYNAVTEIDDEIIEQAKSVKQKKPKFKKYWKQIAAAAAAVLVLFATGKAFTSDLIESSSSQDNVMINDGIDYDFSNGIDTGNKSEMTQENGNFAIQESLNSSSGSDSTVITGGEGKQELPDDTGSTGSNEQYSNQKLVKTMNLSLETEEFDKCLQNINQKVGEIGGYVEDSEINGRVETHTRYASLTLRIPSERLEELRGTLENYATITYSTESTKDVTLEFVDTESRLKALRTELDTLLKLLESATKLSDILSIQTQITNVRYQIESYESRLRTMQNKVSYGTININIKEVDKETSVNPSFFDEIKDGFAENVENIYDILREFVIWFICAIPYFPFIAVATVIIIAIKKHKKNKK